MLEEQGGVCAICRGREGRKYLAVDHSHVTGCVRGLLCTRCNVAVGFCEKYGKAAESYLRKFDATHITDQSLLEADILDNIM